MKLPPSTFVPRFLPRLNHCCRFLDPILIFLEEERGSTRLDEITILLWYGIVSDILILFNFD